MIVERRGRRSPLRWVRRAWRDTLERLRPGPPADEGPFLYDFSICAIFKDEAKNLAEWLHFHDGIGADHFYLYNDASTDEFETVLAPWIESGKVTLTDWSDGEQVPAYDDCVRRFAGESRWIAFIDLDEFLFSPKARNIKQVLASYRDVAAIFVYWILFGSSGHMTRPTGYVIDSYTRCLELQAAKQEKFDHKPNSDMANYVSGWARDGKSIVNPRMVAKMEGHRPKALRRGRLLSENRRPRVSRSGDEDISNDVFRINHYWAKSIEELTEKTEKGSIHDKHRPHMRLERALEREAGLNGSVDETIRPYWNAIKAERGL